MEKVRATTEPLVYRTWQNAVNTSKVITTLKEKKEHKQTLFEQVVMCYQEELNKLGENDLPDADSIYLRNGGNEIFVWVVMKDFNEETVDKISLISLKVSHLVLSINVELYTLVEYLGECHLTFSAPEYIKIYSSN